MPQLSQAQLANMRQVMAQNPAMTQALIQQIAATNPALLQQLGADPERVIAEILQSATDDGMGEDDEEGPVPPGAHVLNVTPEERDAIERVRIPYLPWQDAAVFILFNHSWKPSDSPGSWSSKPTLRAIRTRN